MCSRELKVGHRVECDGFTGSVHFIGEIHCSKGVWVGIDWDDPKRGKHGGSVDGHKYFTAKSESSASFVREHKLNKGISFMEALKERYAAALNAPKGLLNLPQPDGNQRIIECVGFEKVAHIQSEFKHLEEIDLSGMKVAYCDADCSEMKTILCHTKILILANNLFSSWDEIGLIIRNMPQLTHLVLSNNKLSLPQDNAINKKSFRFIKNLIIDRIDYDWDQVLFCSFLWPNLERLDLWGNRINSLKVPESQHFSELQYLSLCNNSIASWKEVCKLGKMPRLKTLNIGCCQLKEVIFEDADYSSKTKLFKELRELFLNSNQIANWRDVAELNKLEKLESLIIKDNPVFESENYDTNFSYILARIKNLKVLNKELITPLMRRDGELYYLKRFYKEFVSCTRSDESNENNFMLSHPRFNEILSEYGAPFEVDIDPKTELTKRKFITVNIRCSQEQDKTIEKKLPASISISNLKIMIRRLFHINLNDDINLLWTSKNFVCPLDKEMQNLNFYSIENGDMIIVEIKNS